MICWEKVYFGTQILEQASVDQYWNIFSVIVFIYNIGWHLELYENKLHMSWMISNDPKGKLDIIRGKCSMFSYNPK